MIPQHNEAHHDVHDELQEAQITVQEEGVEKTWSSSSRLEVEGGGDQLAAGSNYNNNYVRMGMYSVFVLVGQSTAVLLGRLYFDKGGHSKWIATLVQTCGFPILIPFLFINNSSPGPGLGGPHPPTSLVARKTWLYVSLGALIACYCMLFSIGVSYLPVSTYSLVSATQLGFNTFFSFFLNSQKITPFIVNSLFLLTLSSVLLVFQPEGAAGGGDSVDSNQGKYIIGFLSTVGGSAACALWLSLMQLSFRKILKNQVSLNAVFDAIVYQSLFATSVITIGLFASGEWKMFGKEINEFEMGKVGYVMTLVWTAVCWQVFAIGSVGLIYEVSSLFSNVISTLSLPMVPVIAVFVFHDKMDGVKVVSLLLAVWGFVSYIYQHYIDHHHELKMKNLALGITTASSHGDNDDHRRISQAS